MSNVTYLRPPQLPGPLIEQAAEAIRSRIVNGELELGAPLSETALAVELGVSKTPVREAFLRLETEGLIEIKPHHGTFVFDMDADEVRDLCELREVLEIAAARVAVRRRPAALADALEKIIAGMHEALRNANILEYRTMDRAYHQRIVEHAGNAVLAATYETLAVRIQALRNRLTLDPVLNRRSMREHRELAALIRAGEVYRTCTCLSDHIRGVEGALPARHRVRRLAPSLPTMIGPFQRSERLCTDNRSTRAPNIVSQAISSWTVNQAKARFPVDLNRSSQGDSEPPSPCVMEVAAGALTTALTSCAVEGWVRIRPRCRERRCGAAWRASPRGG